MANTITTSAPAPLFNAVDQDSLSLDAALTTARIGVHLDADRVEVWALTSTTAQLSARWVSTPDILESDEPHVVPRDWFPWNDESVDPHDAVVCRDPELFPLTMSRQPRDAEGIETAVLMPLRLYGSRTGAVCVYWHTAESGWDPASADWLYTAGLDALEALGR